MVGMRATMIYSPGDIRLEEVPDPQLQTDNDAIVQVVSSCVCGSDLWPYRGVSEVKEPRRIGHEFIGIVTKVGADVTDFEPGDFVIAPFVFSDNTCKICAKGIHTSCQNGGFWGAPDKEGLPVDGCQGEFVRVPLADGTLVKVPNLPDESMLPHLLALSDVFPTGHHAAVSAGVTPGSSVVVVGDGAVGLSAVLAAKRLGATKIVAMSRHEDRQAVAKEFGATHLVAERGKIGANEAREICDGIGADFVLECVGTNDSMRQASLSARPGGKIGYVGVPHDIRLNIPAMFGANISLSGGVAPVRAYLPELLPEVLSGQIAPGRVFDRTYALADVADAYRDMDERKTIKALLKP